MITKRQIEKNTDFRLNMEMQKSCRRDMPKFCKHIMDRTDLKDGKELEGEMMGCLKKLFIEKQKVCIFCSL